VRRRLEGLSAGCHDLLRLAAAIGREFTASVLARAAGRESGAALALLDEGATAGGVISPQVATGPRVVAPVLVRRVLYDELEAGEQRDAHRRIGAVLVRAESDAATDWSEVAHHFFRAAPGGDVDSAVEYARRAGAQAAERLAYEEAAVQYGRALAALRPAPVAGPPPDCSRQLGLGQALQLAGGEGGTVRGRGRTGTVAAARVRRA